jgi:hypothetical protein
MINSYLCEHFVKDNGEMLMFNNYIYAKNFKEANMIMLDLKDQIGLIYPRIKGRLIDVIESGWDEDNLHISEVDLTPYFIYFQLDKIIEHSLLTKEILENAKNALISYEAYELVAVMHKKLKQFI